VVFYAVGIPVRFFAYFLTVMRATGSDHLFFDTTNCAVRHPRQWIIFPEFLDDNFCYIFNGKN
jgi:hypothetical protein